MKAKVLTTIRKYTMIEQGETVFAAVSGGADSVALLHLLYTLREELGFQLQAIHLNHNLRGAESHRDARYVTELCETLDVPLISESADVSALAKERGLSVEMAAREARYGLFHRYRHLGKVALGHTMSDNAETVLLNLTRGTGIRGLCGIPPVREGYLRPLIEVTREETEGYCREHGLRFVTDSTNGDDRYRRNRIRHGVLPVLREMNPGLPQTLTATAELLREDADYLDGQAAEARKSLRLPEQPGAYSREGYGALPSPIRMRVLRDLLVEAGLPYHRERLLRLDRLVLDGGDNQEDLNRRLFFVVRNGAFFLREEEPPLAGFAPISLRTADFPCHITPFQGKKLSFLLQECKEFENISLSPGGDLKNSLNCDRIGTLVTIRPRNAGDRVRLAGRGCTKSLKSLFRESGLSPEERARTLILESGGEIIWVEGFGATEKVAAKPGDTRILTVQTVNT